LTQDWGRFGNVITEIIRTDFVIVVDGTDFGVEITNFIGRGC
jgi:hypothetical protein